MRENRRSHSFMKFLTVWTRFNVELLDEWSVTDVTDCAEGCFNVIGLVVGFFSIYYHHNYHYYRNKTVPSSF